MDGFPEKYHILPTFEQLVEKARRFAKFMTSQSTELCLSEHIREPNNQLTLPFDEPHAVSEGWLPYDSEGRYLNPDL